MLKKPAAVEKADFFLKQGSQCDQILAMFSLFANKNRFKILCALKDGNYCVNDLVEITGGKPSNISQQLKILTLAGFLGKKRQGKLVYYHLKDRTVSQLFDFLYEHYGSKPGKGFLSKALEERE